MTGKSTDLQSIAKQHLMLGFSDLRAFDERPIPILTQGDGCHILDDAGNRYLDALSGLYCLSLGHSFGGEIGDAAAAQMTRLPYASNFSAAHPPSIELAERITDLAPDTFDRVFFVSGGSEAVESAWKLAIQFHQANGEPQRRKAIARKGAYHGVTLGALSLTGLPAVREAFDPVAIPVRRVSNTNAFRHPHGDDPARFCQDLLSEIEEAIEQEGPDTIAMLVAEPVQNAGGSIVPPPGYWTGLREICDRYGILLCSEEVVCAFGRLGYWFGADRLGYQPDLITFAKGFTGGHFPMGGVLVSERVSAPFLDGRANYSNGFTFGGHPVGCAVANAVLDIYEREEVFENVRETESYFQSVLEDLRDIPIVGDVRGMGFLWSIELVEDQQSNEQLGGGPGAWILGEVLSPELWSRGLICRLDGRADPTITLAPPLVMDRGLIDELAAGLRAALEVTAERALTSNARAA